ncbi:MAG: GntR family transcriptional regulator [Thermomicrobiales bacterium]|jgi:DNA-binding GntR family transcriptional regulator|nr:GntR family transcriptional regulator [Thermomicrobiales bacterium]
MTSVSRVYENTRRSIIDGDFPPGSPLKVNDLANLNDVSLIPVREAIRMLASEGLVEVVPYRGAFVSQVSMGELVDIYKTRIVLEMEAVRQAAPKIGPAEIATGRDLVQQVYDAVVSGSDDFLALHRSLHFLLYDRSESAWLLRLINMLWDHTERYRQFSMPRVDPATILDEHNAILDCLEAGDADGAVSALRTHLENSVRFHRDNEAQRQS